MTASSQGVKYRQTHRDSGRVRALGMLGVRTLVTDRGTEDSLQMMNMS